MDIRSFAYGGLITVGSTGLILWAAKRAIEAGLKRLLQADLANLKHELDVKKEVIKSELSREAQKSQLMLQNMHVIYPRLSARLERAFGAVAGLQGVTFEPAFSRYSNSELKNYLRKIHSPEAVEVEIDGLLLSNRPRAIKRVEEAYRDWKFEDARKKCVAARNYGLLKALYCSDRVQKAFDDCMREVWSAWVDMDTGRSSASQPAIPELWAQGSKAIRGPASEKMDEFRKVVRSELRPES